MSESGAIRVVIAATHPIQYHIPWFRELSRQPGLDVRVVFGVLPDAQAQGKGFGVAFQWDIPMLEGYTWEQLDTVLGAEPLAGFGEIRLKNAVAQLRRLRPDVLLLTGWQNLYLLQLLAAARWLGIPCCVRGESNGLKPRRLRVRLVHRLLLAQYRAFLSIGEANRRFYATNQIPPERLFPCRYFVENQRFRQQADDALGERSRWRDHWGIPDDAVCFAFVGKFEPKKRPLDILQALALALALARGRGDAPPMHLLMVGTGPLLDEARTLAERLALPVSFAGFLNQTEISAAYVACDCLVLASDYDETWGLVVNEAMASGRCAIVSDRAGCSPDLIESGKTGWLFPFGDVAMLGDRLCQAAADPPALGAMGEAAQQRVFEHYDVDQAVAGTVAAVRALVRDMG